jgi:hypothetical protein
MHSMERAANQLMSCPRLDISGAPVTASTARGRLLGAVVLMALATLVGWVAHEENEPGNWWFFVAAVLVFLALIVPASKHRYIDLQNRCLVNHRWYAGFQVSRRETQLESFSHIVLRHICHSSCEAGDSYTASVGLEPAESGEVTWVLEIPASSEELPREAVTFAQQLERRTGIPLRRYPDG